jgi:hypothetical protein
MVLFTTVLLRLLNNVGGKTPPRHETPEIE